MVGRVRAAVALSLLLCATADPLKNTKETGSMKDINDPKTAGSRKIIKRELEEGKTAGSARKIIKRELEEGCDGTSTVATGSIDATGGYMLGCVYTSSATWYVDYEFSAEAGAEVDIGVSDGADCEISDVSDLDTFAHYTVYAQDDTSYHNTYGEIGPFGPASQVCLVILCDQYSDCDDVVFKYAFRHTGDDSSPSSQLCATGCSDGWLGDGVCDSACDNAACQYDAGDCSSPSSTPSDSSSPSSTGPTRCPAACSGSGGNGQCDAVCNIEVCNYDGGDCLSSGPSPQQMQAQAQAQYEAARTSSAYAGGKTLCYGSIFAAIVLHLL